MIDIIYSCAGNGIITPSFPCNITYSDLFVKRDIIADMRLLNYNLYDIILISPPCNYWSRANYRRNSSEYSLITKDLLPFSLKILKNSSVPVIVENVRNARRFSLELNNLLDDIFITTIYKHTFFSNINFSNFDFMFDFDNYPKSTNHNNISRSERQGDYIVQDVFSCFCDYCGFTNFKKIKELII